MVCCLPSNYCSQALDETDSNSHGILVIRETNTEQNKITLSLLGCHAESKGPAVRKLMYSMSG